MTAKTGNHREQILDAAQQLMLMKGFPAARVDEICEAAGVTKGSFYHHFVSKDELALVLVDRYFTGLAEKLCAGTWQNVEAPVDRVFAFLDHTVTVTKGPLLRQGCLLGSFALNLAETHPEIRQAIEDRFCRLVDVLEPMLRAALKEKKVSGDASAGMLARQLVSVLQGSIVMAKAYGDHGKVVESVRCYRTMLRAVLHA